MPEFTENIYTVVKKSNLVNEKWYLEKYPDVTLSGLDAISHYLKYGWKLQRNPCKRFDAQFYKRRYKVQNSHNPLLHYIRIGSKKGYCINQEQNVTTSVTALATHLWGGHPKDSVAALEKIYNDINIPIGKRCLAVWHVARRAYFEGDYEKSLKLGKLLSELDENNEKVKEACYLNSFSNMYLGEWNAAKKLLKSYLASNPSDCDAILALTNTLRESKFERLELINKAFALAGFSPIKMKDDAVSLTIDNLARHEDTPVIREEAKVSIIMPIYNAKENVGLAIRSLLEQSYVNIEIIAVDDCSTDGTYEIIKSFEKLDKRVVAVQTCLNGGAYAARNYGLEMASGDYITTHDSDDWSHPQKIERQVEYLNSHDHIMGCVVHWIRAKRNLNFTQNWRPSNSLTHWSHSSFMFRKKIIDDIGVWDEVRVGGDTEYIWRMQAYYGKKSFSKIFPYIPLAFALDEETSLTRTKATHVCTVYHGLRHIYRETRNWLHVNRKDIAMCGFKDYHFFPLPKSMFSKDSSVLQYEVIIAGNFSSPQDCDLAESVLNKLSRQRVAVLHMADFNTVPAKLNDKYFRVLLSKGGEPVVMGQEVRAKKYYITTEGLRRAPSDLIPIMHDFKEWSVISHD